MKWDLGKTRTQSWRVIVETIVGWDLKMIMTGTLGDLTEAIKRRDMGMSKTWTRELDREELLGGTYKLFELGHRGVSSVVR